MLAGQNSNSWCEPLGIYVSIPFCKAKCSFCNFASGVFAGERLDGYLDRLLTEMDGAEQWAAQLGAKLPDRIDTVYFGGGTPSLLDPAQVRRLFGAIRVRFQLDPDAEVTVEAAPGQLAPETLDALLACGVNRLSFGVQSFVDAECAAVGRLHTAEECHAELRCVAAAGFTRVGIDLIAGLPGQTMPSWAESIDQAIATGVEHVSVYMLEVDEDSRLGREAIRGGSQYGASALPDEDSVADSYSFVCERLARGGIAQYEISNFARTGGESRHNKRYWERRPYVGFGLDAHSMLHTDSGPVRWANAETMDVYMHGLIALGGQGNWGRTVDRVGRTAALEESLFLGLRLIEGVSLSALKEEFGLGALDGIEAAWDDVIEAGLLTRNGDRLSLTPAGRMASNEVFSRLLLDPVA